MRWKKNSNKNYYFRTHKRIDLSVVSFIQWFYRHFTGQVLKTAFKRQRPRARIGFNVILLWIFHFIAEEQIIYAKSWIFNSLTGDVMDSFENRFWGFTANLQNSKKNRTSSFVCESISFDSVRRLEYCVISNTILIFCNKLSSPSWYCTENTNACKFDCCRLNLFYLNCEKKTFFLFQNDCELI